MKNIFKFSALFCAMTFLVTSCSQDAMFEPEEPQYKPAVVGDEIIFGSRAGFENANPGTRTVYSGEKYKVGDVEFERIDWVNDDLVEIYCPQAAGEKAFTYKVTRRPVNETGKDENGNVIDVTDHFDEAYLSKIDENSNGLAWSSDEEHYFYAMYPSVEQIKEKTENPDITVVQGIKMDGSTLKGVVPVSQPGIELDESTAAKVLKPNMDYAYMAAHATATKEDGAVTLNFVPIVTALEIELKTNGVDTKISDIRVEGPGVSGSFSADLSYEAWGKTQTYPTCVNGDEYVQDYITIPLPKTVELNATKNESLKFTVFLRPGVDYSSLTVRYTETGQAWPAKILGDGKVETTEDNIIAQKKNVVTNFKLTNKKFEIDASHWLNQLPDDRKMGYLSLPGTGGSFSYKYPNTSNGSYYMQQNTDMTFEAQWKAGIRAFELVVDRGSDTSKSLGDENLTCNKTSVGEKFGNAMASIRNKVSEAADDGKKECAVVVVTYQPEGRFVGQGRERDEATFATTFENWWKSLSDNDKNIYKLYTPKATLGEMRGKVMVLLRLDQLDESDDNNVNDAIATINKCKNTEGCPFVFIRGCGTAKDRWGARGYQIKDQTTGTVTPCAHISNGKSGDANVIENHMRVNPGLAFSDAVVEGFVSATSPKNSSYIISRPALGEDVRGGLKFNYATNVGFECWYQEWARVVIGGGRYGSDGWFSDYHYWFESLSEKKSNVEQTFKMAIFSDPSDNNAMVYVNSLCGYSVTDDFSDSHQYSTGSTYGGAGGDVKKLAEQLNPWFAELVHNAGLEQATGPTGVIFMDYITPEMEVIGRIIANNFKS